MTSSILTGHNGAIRASDADREKGLDLLRQHWLAGRLTLEEYEERCEEATVASFIDQLRFAVRELPYPLPEHGLAGLTPAAAAAPAPAAATPHAQRNATASVVLGSIAMCFAWVPFLFLLSLPMSIGAWLLGRRVRRADRDLVRRDMRVTATVGEVMGIVSTAMGLLALTACGMIFGIV